jgi:membrane protease YdiL (CAAX protease family)
MHHWLAQAAADSSVQRLIEQWPMLASYLAAGLTALVTLWYGGLLDSAMFRDAPPRKCGLVIRDLFIGGWLLLACAAFLAPLAFKAAGIQFNLDGQPAEARDAAVAALIGQLVAQLPVVLFILVRLARTPGGFGEFGLLPGPVSRDLIAGGVGFLAAVPLTLGATAVAVGASLLLHQDVPQVGHRLLQQMISTEDHGAKAMMIASAVLLAPLMEEIIFRGLVQTTLLHWTSSQGPARRWSVIIIASGLFAVIHAGAAQPHTMPALFVLGLVLGWLYECFGSLLPCVLVHMAFNVFNIGVSLAGVGS